MDVPPVGRRLSAVLVADVVAFSRHMERNEAATFARLHEIREHVIDPKLAQHGGRLIKSTGDGVLVEFASALSALRAAVEIQREMGLRNLYLAPDARFEFRIGINLGDIIIDGEDIAGDGVNVAARLEALALPGGICVSAAVREQVHEELDAGFVDIGDQQVKNIARAIRAYRVVLVAGDAESRLARGQPRPTPQRIGLIAGGLAVIAVGGAMAWLLGKPGSTSVAFAPPPNSLAVMPFVVSGGDASDGALADSLSQDVANEIKRVARPIRIASTALTAAYKGKNIDPRAAGRELDVRYLAQGELKRAGSQMFVISTLIDAPQALQIWGERTEIDLAAVTSAPGQQELAAAVAHRLHGAVLRAEVSRILKDPAQATTPIELCFLAMGVWDQEPGYLDGARKGRKYFDEALKRDPNITCALVGLAEILDTELWADPLSEVGRLLPPLDDLTKRALAADPNDAYVWMYRGIALAWQRRWDSAHEAYRRAEAIDPLYAWPVTWQAFFMLTRGEPKAAIDLAGRAIRMDRSQNWPTLYALWFQCEGYLLLDRVDEAVAACNKSLAGLDRWETHMLLASAHARTGNLEAAASHRAALQKHWSGFSIAAYETWLRKFNDERRYLDQRERAIIPGLRKAGVPER